MIELDGGLSTLCHSWEFACQHRALKTLFGPDYILTKDGIIWLWYFFVNLKIYPIYIYIYIYMHGRVNRSAICLLGGMVFWAQRSIKTFFGIGYFCSEDRVVWIWHFLVNLLIYLGHHFFTIAQSQCLLMIGSYDGLNTLYHIYRLLVIKEC